MGNRIKKQLNILYPELKALITNDVPEFVYKKDAKLEDQIVVFSFHTPDPLLFDKQMRYLAENNYKTVTTDDFHGYLFGYKDIPSRCVMLTFDDCRASVWVVVYPILKKYNLHGVVYVNPFCISKEKGKRPQWNGEDSRQCTKIDSSEYPFSTWEEIFEMHETDILDFQGHSYYHELIFVAPKIIDFLDPQKDLGFFGLNTPVLQDKGKNRYDRSLFLGTPFYKMEPRMGGKRRYFDDEGLRKHCVDYVRRNGGKLFFENRKWKKQLFTEVKKYKRIKSDRGYFESPDEMKLYLRNDLLKTRKSIEAKLPGKKLTSMCFPWEVGSDVAIEVAKEVGYQSCVWGIIPGRKTNYIGDDSYHICRISSDFILRLPGKGRISFLSVIMNKLSKRINRFKNLNS